MPSRRKVKNNPDLIKAPNFNTPKGVIVNEKKGNETKNKKSK